MKQFINELISRLEEYKSKAYVSGMSNNSYEYGFYRAMGKAIDDVNELAEEYSQHANFATSGWIPVSERLPEEGTTVLVQDFEDYYEVCNCETKLGVKGFSNGDWWASAGNYLAWMPLPEPFSPSLVQDSPSLAQDWKDSMLNKFDGREV